MGDHVGKSARTSKTGKQAAVPVATPSVSRGFATKARDAALDWRSWLPYVVLALVSLLAAAWVLRLDLADLRVPFSDAPDSVWSDQQIKGLIDNGTWYANPAVGAPGGLSMVDRPLSDGLIFVLIRIIAVAFPNYAMAKNLYFILTFPLTAVIAMYTLRRLGASLPGASLAALLYAFVPYHFLRGEMHLFLASYFMLPLFMLVMLKLFAKRAPFLSDNDGHPAFSFRDPTTIWAVVVCVLTASSGLYYAFFACFLLVVTGALAWARFRDFRRAIAAALLIAAICAGLAVNVAPNLIGGLTQGRNPVISSRGPLQAEVYALRMNYLLLPIADHRLGAAATLSQAYRSGSGKLSVILDNENGMATLGIVGSVGFLYLLGWLLAGWAVRRGRGEPGSSTRGDPRDSLSDGLASLTGASVLLAMIGGFGSLFALFVSGELRAYNRISIFIAFFALAAAALLFDRAMARWSRANWVPWAVAALLVAIGLLDQTSPAFAPDYPRIKAEQQVMETFVAGVEQALPPGSMVFQLPYTPFPESPPVNGMADYEHFRAYLASKTLRWSYGAMKGRDEDAWQAAVSQLDPAQMIAELKAKSFAAVYIDGRGYQDGGAATVAAFKAALGTQPLVSSDGNYFVLVLPGT